MQNTALVPTIGVMGVVTGKNFEKQGIALIYATVDALLGRGHSTLELGAAADLVCPALLEQFPWLGDVQRTADFLDREKETSDAYLQYAKTIVDIHGDYLEAQPVKS